MKLFVPSNRIKLILVLLLIFLGVGSVVYNQYLVTKILEQERASVELWTRAIEFNSQPVDEQASTMLLKAINILEGIEEVPDSVISLIEDAETTRNSSDFVTEEIILEDRFKIPTIVIDSQDVILHQRNIDSLTMASEQKREELVREFKSLNNPIDFVIGDEKRQMTQFVYYGESPTVQMLRYFPYIQILLLGLLLGIGYTTYRSITRSEQSNLWVGMAKEAAHQLGTPISSLYGWLQLLKDEYRYEETATNIANEIEKDIQRLRGVAERFGKIGSEPELKTMDIQPILEQVMVYMERRLPRLGKAIEVKKELNATANVKTNPELLQWAIENLVKNAMDSLKGIEKEAYISVTSKVQEGEVIIDIEDSGSGIEIQNVKNIFKPGFSTKKRGWGLGLSLTKRIIEDYHNGSVFVLRSELNEGTTMRVTLNIEKSEEEVYPLLDQSPV
ncbi:MAG: HAMP domain-containing histidine kinase [Gracilimonas sp.]|uniref:histidine kinase n=1 Tax=Gracilimonas sediminicola TaxID=2952158 RepID=A0A9X2L338_9BACT|nr:MULTISPECIES: HAMP domain-containing sensor histidine kinase [Gracilimonas]MBO6584997.1 HAMP domain-containing histidine kinase [Gracilimonas sp.]MBO6615732.1 HAMP domain-containing histidine kinase [Gracilimonas sp.]MCP9291443.1 HAMP domain-containing histidine kinase [Gracilimonas sediminicola]